MSIFRLGAAFAGLALAASAIPALAQQDPGAAAPSGPPAGRIYGTVLIDGNAASTGTTIVAFVGDTVCGQSTYDPTMYAAKYFVDISSTVPCNQPGATIAFSINGCGADQGATVPQFNDAERMDLTAPGSC